MNRFVFMGMHIWLYTVYFCIKFLKNLTVFHPIYYIFFWIGVGLSSGYMFKEGVFHSFHSLMFSCG